MSGAKATMQRQDTLANNLANVSTVGFRAELAAFRAVPVEGSGASTRVYALESTPGYDATPGAGRGHRPQPRRRDEGRRPGSPCRGSTAPRPTRAAARSTSTPTASWSPSAGLTVLGDGGPIQVPPDTEVSIAADGTVSATAANGRSTSIGKLKLVTPEAPLHARQRRPVPRRRRRPAGRPERARAGRRARRLERQRRSRRWSR